MALQLVARFFMGRLLFDNPPHIHVHLHTNMHTQDAVVNPVPVKPDLALSAGTPSTLHLK